MFPEIEFERMKRLPNYVFAEVNNIKMEARRAGEDIIDFSMGNPDGPAPNLKKQQIKQKTTVIAQVQEYINLDLPFVTGIKENMGLITLTQTNTQWPLWEVKKGM